jgi:hypothetical protein
MFGFSNTRTKSLTNTLRATRESKGSIALLPERLSDDLLTRLLDCAIIAESSAANHGTSRVGFPEKILMQTAALLVSMPDQLKKKKQSAFFRELGSAEIQRRMEVYLIDVKIEKLVRLGVLKRLAASTPASFFVLASQQLAVADETVLVPAVLTDFKTQVLKKLKA